MMMSEMSQVWDGLGLPAHSMAWMAQHCMPRCPAASCCQGAEWLKTSVCCCTFYRALLLQYAFMAIFAGLVYFQ
jgi:hypothetical protein